MNEIMSNTNEENVIWEEKNLIEPTKKSENKIESEETDSTPITKSESVKKECNDIGKISGIYKIVNKIDGKYYVGSSTNICNGKTSRWNMHISYLKSKIHHNDYLQNAWNKYGESNFDFIVVEKCNIENLIEIEQKYLSIAEKEQKKCYNLSFIASHPGKFTNYVRQKISDAIRGDKNPNFGKPMSESTKLKISLSKMGQGLGRKLSMKTIQKIKLSKLGKSRPQFSDEWKNNIAKKSKLKWNDPKYRETIINSASKTYKLYSPTGEIITIKNLAKFCRENNINYGNMSRMIRGKLKSCKKYKFHSKL
jgi:group I intron endonuclease